MKQSEYELRKISEGVFDKSTIMAIGDLSRKGVLDDLCGLISIGKEANVYLGKRGVENVAVKIYLIDASDFKTMERYIKGDRRFASWRNHRDLIFNWAKKEFKNLSRLHGVIDCPKPIAFHKNILVMEFIGEGDVPAPRLKDLPPEDPDGFYLKVREYMKNMYEKEVVHGDFSEYNILNAGRPVVIDLSAGVLLDHPMAGEFLERDVFNIVKYFRKQGVECDEKELLDYIKNARVNKSER